MSAARVEAWPMRVINSRAAAAPQRHGQARAAIVAGSPSIVMGMGDPEARMRHWQRCIAGRPKWPFHVATHCTDPNSIKALADHLEHAHSVPRHFLTGWYPPVSTWEKLLQRHQAAHDREGWNIHSHAGLPDVSWP